MLIIGRVVQGLGGAVFPLSFGILRDEFPPARVASAIGGLSAVIAVGGGLGVVLAGPIVAALDWRALFWIPMSWSWRPRSPDIGSSRVARAARAAGSTGSPGRCCPGWLVALILPLSEAPALGMDVDAGPRAAAAALVLIVAWVWWSCAPRSRSSTCR